MATYRHQPMRVPTMHVLSHMRFALITRNNQERRSLQTLRPVQALPVPPTSNENFLFVHNTRSLGGDVALSAVAA